MVVREYGAMEGGSQTIDRLEQELLTMKLTIINHKLKLNH